MRNRVSFNAGTYLKAREFRNALTQLEVRMGELSTEKKITLAHARVYLLSKMRDPDIPEEIYEEIDRIQEIRKAGIQKEMIYAKAQADLAMRDKGEAFQNPLTEEVLSGDSIQLGFSAEVLDDVPSLEVYTLFPWFTVQELKNVTDR